jgi:hypothetical protein
VISRTHLSGKELFVRIPKDGKAIRPKRAASLIHERPDVIIAETQQVLSLIESVLVKRS